MKLVLVEDKSCLTQLCVHLAAKIIKKQQQNSQEGSREGVIITEKGI